MLIIKTINASTAHQWLEEEKAILIDVREQSEYDQEHIPGSVFVPLSCFETELVPILEGKILIFHCRSGMRSDQACRLFLDVHPGQDIYNLQGGILAWKEQGFPVE